MPRRSARRQSDLFDPLGEPTPGTTQRSIPAAVTPAVLRWARETAGLDMPAVARRFRKIQLWERGPEKPSVTQLEALSDLYKRPLVTFFLASPPEEPPLPRDFRVLPSAEARALSKKVRLGMRMARRTQRLYVELARELQQDTRRTRLPRVSLNDDPEEHAQRVRGLLGVTPVTQSSWGNEYVAWREWRSVVEDLSVLVLQATMPVKEVRGFSLSDGSLPTIVVSSSDAVVARIFTLFHELGHLLLDTGGMCLPDQSAEPGSHAVEAFCNRFSGALLMPFDLLRSEVSLRGLDRVSDDSEVEMRISLVAKEYKVSRYVILLRLLLAQAIPRTRFQRLVERWKSAAVPPRSGGGQRPAVQALNQYGARFVSMVLEARARNLLTTSDASSYLSLRVTHFPQLQRLVAGPSRG